MSWAYRPLSRVAGLSSASDSGAVTAAGSTTVAFASPNFLQISFVSDSSTTYGSRTNTTITAPSGIQDDDFLLLTIFLGASGTAPDPSAVPSGFTEIGTAINVTDAGSFNAKHRSYYKRASSESGNYTVSHTTASSQGHISVFRGVDWTDGPFSGIATQNSGTGTTRTWTGLTPDVPNTMLAAVGFDWGSATNNLSPPSGMTEYEEVNPLIYAAYEEVGLGATGNRSHTCNSSASNPWGARLIGLRPLEDVPATSDGVLSSAGVAAGALVGAQNQSGSASASGVAASSLIGNAAANASISSSGSASTSLVGRDAAFGSLSSAGVAGSSLVGAASQSGVLSAAGTASAANVGASSQSGAVSAAGVAGASLVGAANDQADGAVSAGGVASVSLVGAQSQDGALSASGVASASLVGSSASTADGVLSAAGSSTASFASAVTQSGAFSGQGSASVSFVGQAINTDVPIGRSGVADGKYRRRYVPVETRQSDEEKELAAFLESALARATENAENYRSERSAEIIRASEASERLNDITARAAAEIDQIMARSDALKQNIVQAAIAEKAIMDDEEDAIAVILLAAA